MGYFTHHAICVTSWDEDEIKKAHDEAERLMPELVSPIVGPVVNGYCSFFVAPDGSKEGWRESDEVDIKRIRFVSWLENQAYEDGSSPYNWVYVQYGDDRGITKIVDDSDAYLREEGKQHEKEPVDDNRYSVCPECGRNLFINGISCAVCAEETGNVTFEADGYITVYEIETGKRVAQYEGLEVHHAIQSLSAAADLMEEARKRNEELEDRLAKSQQQARQLVGKPDHQQRLQKLERVVKTARQFTREVLENVGYDFVVEAQNMMAILDEVLGVKKAPFSPSECAHKDLQLVRYDAGPQTEKESKPEWSVTIKICPDCGQFLVQTQIHEHHLDYVFNLKQPEHVEAAGKTVEYYKHLAREMRETHGH